MPEPSERRQDIFGKKIVVLPIKTGMHVAAFWNTDSVIPSFGYYSVLLFTVPTNNTLKGFGIMSNRIPITVANGDGIGPEIMAANSAHP